MKKLSLASVLLFVLCVSLNAQSLEDILGKYYDAIGGPDKMKAVKTLVQEGTMSMPMMGAEMQMTIMKKRPNFYKSVMDMQGQKMIQAYDGKKAWMVSPMMGMMEPTVLEGEQAEGMLRQAEFDGDLIDYKKSGTKLELVGEVEFEGSPAYKIVATRKNDQVVTFYIDKDTSLLIGTELTVNQQGQVMDITLKFSDYEEVDGLMFSHTMEFIGMQEMSFDFTNIEINKDIPDTEFQMPVE